MTQTVTGAAAPDLTRLRTRSDGAALRVYVGGDLIGTVTHVRLPGRGRQKRWRWIVKPSAFAFTGGKRGPAVGYNPADVEPLPGEHVTRQAALAALVEHLHERGARAVAPLFAGDPRAL